MESQFYSDEDNDIALEIRTLVHANTPYHRDFDNSIHGLLHALPSLSIGENGQVPSSTLKEYFNDDVVQETSDDHDDVIVVRGEDNELPTVYTVHGLKKHELPVIGTCVDKRVVPGFRYTVRKLCTERFLFKGQPLVLQSIGLGYGKRITFESKVKNSNDNFFYSDTSPNGYGFGVVAVDEGDTFTVLGDDDDGPVGEGVITQVGQQKETSSSVQLDGSVVKTVSVNFCCDVKYGSNKHGMLPLFHEYTLLLTGVVVLVKKKGAGRAVAESIEQVQLPLLGPCRLQLSQ